MTEFTRIRIDDMSGISCREGRWWDNEGCMVEFDAVTEVVDEQSGYYAEQYRTHDLLEAIQKAQEMARKHGDETVLIRVIDSSLRY